MNETNPVFLGLLWAGGALAVFSLVFGGWILVGGRIPSRVARGFKSPLDAGLYLLYGGFSVLLFDLFMVFMIRDELLLAPIFMIAGWLVYFVGRRRHRPRPGPESAPRGWQHPLVVAIVVFAAVAGLGGLFAAAGYWHWW